MIRFIFASEITTAPASGVAPPASPVPEPRATNAVPCSTQALTTARTSSVEVGKQTIDALPTKLDASRRYRLSSADDTRTRSAGRAHLRRSARVVMGRGAFDGCFAAGRPA